MNDKKLSECGTDLASESSGSLRPAETVGQSGQPWRRVKNVLCVECPECLFIFAAAHTVGDLETYSCPNCGDGAPCGWQPIATAPTDGTQVLLIECGRHSSCRHVRQA